MNYQLHEKHPIELDNLLFLYKLTNNDVNKIKEKKQIDGEIILNVSLNYIPKFYKINASGNKIDEENKDLNEKYRN